MIANTPTERVRGLIGLAMTDARLDERCDKIDTLVEHIDALKAILAHVEAVHARAEKAETIVAKLAAIGKQIAEQDNRCTDRPIFIVHQRVTDQGYEDVYAQHVMWIDDDGSVADTEEKDKLETAYQETGDIPDFWTRTGCRDRVEYVTACFTEQACKDHIAANGHNLREPHIYADSSYRNSEFRGLWDLMVGLHREAIEKQRDEPRP